MYKDASRCFLKTTSLPDGEAAIDHRRLLGGNIRGGVGGFGRMCRSRDKETFHKYKVQEAASEMKKKKMFKNRKKHRKKES